MDMTQYLGAGDFLNAVKVKELKLENKPLKIAKIEEKEIKEKRKPLMSFEGIEQTLVVNSTNNKILTKDFGTSESTNWIGKEIILQITKITMKGELIDSIQVKAV